MKLTGKLSYKLLASKWKRALSFILMCALLSGTAGLLGYYFLNNTQAIDPVSVALVDLDQSSFSTWILKSVEPMAEDTKLIQVHITSEEEKAQTLMRTEGLGAYFVLPKGFFDSILQGENQPLQLVLNPYLPLQTEFIQSFVTQALRVLESSQTGIYTSLTYVQKEYPHLYDELYRSINARYIQLALSHDKMITPEKVHVTGQVEPFPHYLFTTLLFLFTLSSILYIPVFQENLPSPLLRQVHRLGTGYVRQLSGFIVGWFLWTLPTGLLFLLLYGLLSAVLVLPFSYWLVPAFILLVFFVSLLGVTSWQIFKDTSLTTLFLLLFSLGGLFFSGGLLPLAYMNPLLQKVSLFFPSRWLAAALEESALGTPTWAPVFILVGFSLLFFTAALLQLKRSTREVTP